MKSEDRSGSRRWTRLMLLAMLTERDGYGYDLAQRLKSPEISSLSDLAEGRDISPIYRILKELESQGCVEGKRESRTDGRPERRQLRITAAGRQALAEGVTALRKYRKRLDLLTSWLGSVAKSPMTQSMDDVEEEGRKVWRGTLRREEPVSVVDDPATKPDEMEDRETEHEMKVDKKTPDVVPFRRHFVDFD